MAFTPPLRGGFISISGPRGSGKTTLLNTFVHANPEYFFIVISSGAGTTSEDINQAIGRSENLRIRPILLIDDLDKLSHDIQQTILTQKDKFESVVVAYTPGRGGAAHRFLPLSTVHLPVSSLPRTAPQICRSTRV